MLFPSLVFALDYFLPSQERQLTERDVLPYVREFSVDMGDFTGDGAKFLVQEAGASKAVILGEYHGSRKISEFTRAFIPKLNELGYKNFGLEVGPSSGKILAELVGDGSKSTANLGKFNFQTELNGFGRSFTAIPFFSDVTDAEFIAEAGKRKWRIMGVDQEFIFGFKYLFDRAVEKSQLAQDSSQAQLLKDAKSSIVAAYSEFSNSRQTYVQMLVDSVPFNEALRKLAQEKGECAVIARDLIESLAIYELNAQGQVFENNRRRIIHIKKNFAEQLSLIKYDWGKEKLLVKIGAVHGGRGLSMTYQYDVGNTISELCELNGGRSLHICFQNRFWKKNSQVADTVSDNNGAKVLRSFGDKGHWVVIDLRPLKPLILSNEIQSDKETQQWYRQYDLMVLTPTDESPIPNRSH